MVSLSESDVKNMISNEQFIKDYNEYKKNINVDKLRNFLMILKRIGIILD